jgi:glycosyltransferase involved in cell wall biosynthesis
VVQSGLDHAEFPYRPRNGLDPRRPIRILAVGILFPHRRFEDLLIAVRLLKDRGANVSGTIAGDYNPGHPYAKKLQELAVSQGIRERISFAGRVSDAELLRLYQENDIFVFPSHLQSWGLAVFEAMSCGLPVVVSETAGASEVLEHKKTALIIAPKSPEAIAAAITALTEDPRLYRRLSENGRMFVESRLSWPRYADQMLNIFAAFK